MATIRGIDPKVIEQLEALEVPLSAWEVDDVEDLKEALGIQGTPGSYTVKTFLEASKRAADGHKYPSSLAVVAAMIVGNAIRETVAHLPADVTNGLHTSNLREQKNFQQLFPKVVITYDDPTEDIIAPILVGSYIR
jgi:hypothetical protein